MTSINTNTGQLPALHPGDLHRAARRRQLRIHALDTGLWWVAAALVGASVVTATAGFAVGAVVVIAVALGWRRSARLHRRPVTRELAARRAEFVAYRARQAVTGAEHIDDPEHARLCARLDELEADLPWWQRT